MRARLFAMALVCAACWAAFWFGARLTVVETPAGKTLRDIIHDGGPVQQIWTGFSATMTAYIGPLLAMLILGCGAAFAMYLVFLLALKLLARLAKEAGQTVIRPIKQALDFGKDFATGGYGAAADVAGRARDRGADTVVAMKDALTSVAGNIAGRLPGSARQAPDVEPRQIEGVNKA